MKTEGNLRSVETRLSKGVHCIYLKSPFAFGNVLKDKDAYCIAKCAWQYCAKGSSGLRKGFKRALFKL